ncbi:hypothetical protein AA700_1468 [Acidiphilium acidophilum DSM 700]|nr:hypothetical protein AA700_1468 [Acidiphilium acidophilum DSM 700]
MIDVHQATGVSLQEILIYALLWVSFGLGHSLLAATPIRARMTRLFGTGERLAYNIIALIHLALVLLIGMDLFRHAASFALLWPVRALMLLAAIAGAIVLAFAGKSYDFGRFLGTTQWRGGVVETAMPVEPLATGGMNALVRHPLYLGVVLLLFGLADTPFRLETAIAGTLYILIGIHFEERKLIALYGSAYAEYRRTVPMLLPRPRAALRVDR